MFLYLGLLGVLASFSGSYGQEACLTSTKAPGTCINLTECSSLLVLLRQSQPLPAQVVDKLRKAQCGFVGSAPKVCCEREQPPTLPPDLTDQTMPDVSNHRNLRLLDTVNCGTVIEERLISGDKTTVFEIPWMALIAYRRNNSSPEFRCAGSVISKRYVLTAAHCVTGLRAGLQVFGVRLAEHDPSSERDCDYNKEGVVVACGKPYQDYKIESFVAHSGFSQSKLQNDIALIRLSTDVDFLSGNVRPICLPFGDAGNLRYEKATEMGWRTLERNSSRRLLKRRLLIMPNDECTEIYRRYNVDIWFKHMCASDVNRTNSCTRHSGSPLQGLALVNNEPKTIQYGVASFGPKTCGAGGIPGGYTRVAFYMDWIFDNMTD